MALNEQCTTAEAAATLQVDRRTVRRLIEEGALSPTMKLPGKTGAYLFDRADVEALKESRAS